MENVKIEEKPFNYQWPYWGTENFIDRFWISDTQKMSD